MIEKFDASKDTEHPMTEDEAFHAVLGYTSGYCVGLGYGPSHQQKEIVQMRN
ncbi:hypothetical protein LINPERHAP2_LOCUS34992, partial [Linum perenne]